MMQWRSHPKLVGQFHQDYPDDLQVLVHDGGRRFTSARPEMVWVTVNGCYDDVFTGVVINAPVHLETVRVNEKIFFVPADDENRLLMVSGKYLEERSSWGIVPCSGCGLSELFDAPSDLIAATFKDVPQGGALFSFATQCPLCEGKLLVKSTRLSEIQSKKHWWKFW